MQPFVTGPARAWVSFPVGAITDANAPILSNYSTPTPFGTAERGFEIIQDVAYEPVMNDIGGQMKSFDRTFQGKEYLVSGIITRYRETVFRLLSDVPGYLGTGTISEPPGFMGTLMGLEQRAVVLIIEYMYGGGGPLGAAAPFTKPVHASGSLPNGLRFFSADWKGPTRRSAGTSATKIQCLFHCQRIYNPLTGTMAAGDENCASINGLPWEVVP